MKATQQSISEWAETTFGPSGSNVRIAARANEEMAELLRALTVHDDHPKAAAECADVIIVLYRLATRLNVTMAGTADVRKIEFASNLDVAALANSDLALAIKHLATSNESPVVAALLDWITALMALLAERLGTNLADEIDKKMAVNFARSWKLDGSGHGYHVREKGE